MSMAIRGVTRIQDCDDYAEALSWAGGVVFNEAGADVDFRVEGVGEANALFVQGSDGFVGVGTGTPGVLLEIAHANTGSSLVRVRNSGSNVGDINGIDFYHYTYTNPQAYIRDEIGSGWKTKLHFGTASSSGNATTQMTIDGDGNVGIGTATPRASLEINGGGNESLYVIGGTDPRVIIGDTTGGSDYGELRWDTSGNFLELNADSNQHLILQGDGGNVGIGVSDPDAKLEVNGDIHLTADSQKLLFGAAQDYSIQWTGSVAQHTITGGNFEFTNPDGNAKLILGRSHVFKSGGFVFKTGANSDWYLGQPDRDDYAGDGTDFYIGIAEDTPLFLVATNGNVGFKTDLPQGNMQWSDENTHGGLILKTYSASSGTLTNDHTITIQVNVPAGAKILGAQLHVKTALVGGETWNAQYVTGAAQSIGTNQAVAQNTNLSTIFDVNTDTDIASGEVDVTLQRNSNPGVDAFTAQGEIEAVVYVLIFDTWDNE